MADTKAEIARVEKALATTTSPYLNGDYIKKRSEMNGE